MENNKGFGNKISVIATAVIAAVLLAVSQQTSLKDGIGTKAAAARVSAGMSETVQTKTPAVSGNRIVSVNKPLYLIKEDDLMYSNIQWAIAIEPKVKDLIPKDVTLMDVRAENTVDISGNSITFNLPALAGLTPVVFQTSGAHGVEAANISDDMIELIYGFRDDITLYGTITDSGTTRELAEGTQIYHSKNSGYYDQNKFSGQTCYYIHGTIDRVKNNMYAGKGFKSGYRRTSYTDPDMYIQTVMHHDSMYTFPGITKAGQEYIYERDTLKEVRDVEYQAYSRFEIVYFPEDDLYEVEILLLDHGTIEAEGEDGKGRHEEQSGEGDIVYRIIMASDLKMWQDAESNHIYLSDNYVTAE